MGATYCTVVAQGGATFKLCSIVNNSNYGISCRVHFRKVGCYPIRRVRCYIASTVTIMFSLMHKFFKTKCLKEYGKSMSIRSGERCLIMAMSTDACWVGQFCLKTGFLLSNHTFCVEQFILLSNQEFPCRTSVIISCSVYVYITKYIYCKLLHSWKINSLALSRNVPENSISSEMFNFVSLGTQICMLLSCLVNQ